MINQTFWPFVAFDPLASGVGLAELMLCLFAEAGSVIPGLRSPLGTALGGLAFVRDGLTAVVLLALGVGSSSTLATPVGLMNMP